MLRSKLSRRLLTARILCGGSSATFIPIPNMSSRFGVSGGGGGAARIAFTGVCIATFLRCRGGLVEEEVRGQEEQMKEGEFAG